MDGRYPPRGGGSGNFQQQPRRQQLPPRQNGYGNNGRDDLGDRRGGGFPQGPPPQPPPQPPRNNNSFRNNNSRFEFGSSSNQGYGSNYDQFNNQGYGNNDDQYNYDNGFGGDFGNFDQGYFDGNQGGGQGSRNIQRYRRPYRQQSNGNRNFNGPRDGYRGGGRGGYRATSTRPVAPPQAEGSGTGATGDAPPPPQSTPQQEAVVGGVSTPPAVGSGEASKGSKKGDKTLCFRCNETGHMAMDCTAILCIYCEKASHAAKDCHLLSMPRPSVTVYGYCRTELLFYEVPAAPDIHFKHDSGKEARITVVGGSMTAMEVVKELEWIVNVEHQWDVRPAGENVFKAIFPSKAALARQKKMPDIPIPDTGILLQFEDWSASELDSYIFEEAWVRVKGCPPKLRCDYLGLLALGTLLGKTKEVDMEYTRSHEEVRLRVQVTAVKYIPSGTDHMYDGQGYGITFHVEGTQNEAADADMQDVDGHDDRNNGKDKQKEGEPDGQQRKIIEEKSGHVDGSSSTNQHVNMGTNTLTITVGSYAIKASDEPTSLSRRWSDRVDVEEDGLPSPLAKSALPLFSIPPRSAPPAATEKQEVFSAAAQTVLHSGTAIRLPAAAEIQEVSSAATQAVLLRDDAMDSADMSDADEPLQGTIVSHVGNHIPTSKAFELDMNINKDLETATNVSIANATVNLFDSFDAEAGPVVSDVALTGSPAVNSTVHSLVASPQAICGSTPKASCGGFGTAAAQAPSSPPAAPMAGTGVYLGGRYSLAEVEAFGGYMAPTAAMRSSDRIKAQPNADATQLERAQLIAKSKDLAFSV